MTEVKLVSCYNRGCSQDFDPEFNQSDSCRHHPGVPFFHDAYKGWTCCNKKCTDFTEFLNIRGCSYSKHSNEKPIEPPRSVVEKEKVPEKVEVRMPLPVAKFRPDFDSPLITVKPSIAEALKEQTECLKVTQSTPLGVNKEIEIGTICKNSACNTSYEGLHTGDTFCKHHPGEPIFHEGLKFWSCCQKRTSDFDVFLKQEGCTTGKHLWFKETSSVECRWDWHQTATHVVLAVYAKQYDPYKSTVKLNSIRMQLNLDFPLQNNASFQLDLELRDVVDVPKCSVSMLSTKVEIKLVKLAPGSWSKLSFPREIVKIEPTPAPTKDNMAYDDDIVNLDDLVDLDDIDISPSVEGVRISEIL